MRQRDFSDLETFRGIFKKIIPHLAGSFFNGSFCPPGFPFYIASAGIKSKSEPTGQIPHKNNILF